MESVYHIVTICVNETSWAHVWRLHSRYLRMGYDIFPVLVLDMIEILPPLGKYKYDTWRILPVKCYIDNSRRLQNYIQNINNPF
jgi:hypothetical protein